MSVKFSKTDTLLILGALRRAFARSDIYKRVKAQYRIEHEDPKRPRCKKWSWCANCGEVVPDWKADIDHVIPVTPTDKYTYEMTPHEILDAVWCDDNNLANLCEACHNVKSQRERAAKKDYRKRKIDGKRS